MGQASSHKIELAMVLKLCPTADSLVATLLMDQALAISHQLFPEAVLLVLCILAFGLDMGLYLGSGSRTLEVAARCLAHFAMEKGRSYL